MGERGEPFQLGQLSDMMLSSTSELLEFKVSNFNRVAAACGGFLSVFGLVSYLLKEKFHLGEACM